jgi:hypothetical protein
MTGSPDHAEAAAEQAASAAASPGPLRRLGRRVAAHLGRVTLAEWALLVAVALCTW